MKICLIRVFTCNGQGGNLAGVVLDADDLNEKEMQIIATKVNVSEIAFVQKSNQADVKLRFFTPTVEVDLCGHATLATFSILAKQLPPGVYTQETKAGILTVEIVSSDLIFMNQVTPKFLNIIDSKTIAEALTIPTKWITDGNLKPQVVFTGAPDLIVPIDTLEHLLAINPDFEKLKRFSEKNNIGGIHVFTLETVNKKAVAYGRNFAPIYGINEESATGVSNGALGAYLFKNNQIILNTQYIFEQGYSMDQPSEIYVKLENKNDLQVKVGGRVIIDKEIEI